jgi:hypothetical protein
MPDLKKHLQYGLFSHFMMVTAISSLYLGGLVSTKILTTALLTIPFTLIGAVFPDIDHHRSSVCRWVERYVPAILGVIAAAVAIHYRLILLNVTGGRIFGVDSAFAARVGVGTTGWMTWVVTRRLLPQLRPSHRTVTHRISTGILLSVCVAAVFAAGLRVFGVTSVVGSALGCVAGKAFLTGFISHLLADGILAKNFRHTMARLNR